MKKSEKQKFDQIDFKEIAKKIKEVSETMSKIAALMNKGESLVEIKKENDENIEPIVKEKTVKLPNGKTKKVTFISGDENEQNTNVAKRATRPRKNIANNFKEFTYHDRVPDGVIII